MFLVSIPLLGIFLVYAAAAFVAAFELEELGYRRFIPLVPVFFWFVPGFIVSLVLPHRQSGVVWCALLSTILSAVSLYATLRLTWSGKYWVQKILRVTGVVIFSFIVCMVIASALPLVR